MVFQTVIFRTNFGLIDSIRIYFWQKHLVISIFLRVTPLKFSDFYYSKQNRNIIFWFSWPFFLHWVMVFLLPLTAGIVLLCETAISIKLDTILAGGLFTLSFPFRWGLFSAVMGVPFTVVTILLFYASFPL